MNNMSHKPSRVWHILENLFRNAVQHGGDGVSIQIGMLEEAGFYAEDDGPGIPAEMRGVVFDPGRAAPKAELGSAYQSLVVPSKHMDGIVSITASDSGGDRFEFFGVEMEC